MEKLPTPLWDLNEFSDEVYEPREDTFLLLDALETDLSLLKNSNLNLVLEIGSGSGVVITSIVKALPGIYGLGIDINPNACTATRRTAELNDTRVEVVRSDLVNGCYLNKCIDLLLFNPPYLPSEQSEVTSLLDKAWAGSSKGRITTDRLFPDLPKLMSDKSIGYLVAIEQNDPEEMMSILKKFGFDCSVVATKKIIGEKLCVIRFSRGFNFT